MPNYVATYGPMILVMIGNPIIYAISCREVDKHIIGRYSQITSSERALMDKFKAKFSMINLVFYVCWLPNLVNGIILWTMWFDLPIKVIIATWYMMAITNPLQAFLNCLVYRKWTCRWRIRRRSEDQVSIEIAKKNEKWIKNYEIFIVGKTTTNFGTNERTNTST